MAFDVVAMPVQTYELLQTETHLDSLDHVKALEMASAQRDRDAVS
jgi:hypothetical protein